MKNNISKKIKFISDCVERFEQYKPCPYSTEYVCNQIAWIHRYYPEHRKQMGDLADRMSEYLRNIGRYV